ncbi:hypothetical protein P4B35_10930 [Pontiellaceae bacterium B12227]|nr:hypothetical protein [Pontiellaceae bacterium B12227]
MAHHKMITHWLLVTLFCAAFVSHAAKNVLRIGNIINGHQDYLDNPDTFPVSKAGHDYMSYAPAYPTAANSVFDTLKMWGEVGLYNEEPTLTGAFVLETFERFEKNGYTPVATALYLENWVDDRPTGTFSNDLRILSAAELSEIRSAISNSTLKAKSSVKLIQLLGGRVRGQRGDSWLTFDSALKDHIMLFDGVGTECHIGDYTRYTRTDDHFETIEAMADMTKWAIENNKIAFVFMGGGPTTYEDLTPVQLTYNFLWKEMLKIGVDYRSDSIVYLRQGANAGNLVPESDRNTLTHQQKWLTEALDPAGSSFFVSEIPDHTTRFNTPAWIHFAVGKAELPAETLIVTAASSNPTLLSNSNLVVRGRGHERVLMITPNDGQTGSAVVTLSANDGVETRTSSFTFTVHPANQQTAVATGDLNAAGTWDGGAAPIAGDLQTWCSGTSEVRVSSTNYMTFAGHTLEIGTNGLLSTGIAGPTLSCQNFILNGGTVQVKNNLRFTFDFNNNQVTLNSGTLKSGAANAGRNIRFENGRLGGSGTIEIIGSDTNGSYVEVNRSVQTMGFTGLFDIKSRGILHLPYIPPEKASFGLAISGTGTYKNNSDIAVTSLTIDGTSIGEGVYGYADFTPSQQAFLVDAGGTITVVENRSAYDHWALAYELTGGPYDDDDKDGLSNLIEYSIGSNPTNAAASGYLPTFKPSTNGFEYVHVERREAPSGIKYQVEVSTNLVFDSWTTNGIEWVGSGIVSPGFDSITNRVPGSGQQQQFIRTRIESN